MGGGRPTKLTPELHEKIVHLVRAGMFLKDAAEFCNVDYSTMFRWGQRGDMEAFRLQTSENPDEEPLESERPYLEFRNAVRQGRAYANITDMNVIAQAASNDPFWAEKRLRLRNRDLATMQVEMEVNLPTPEEVMQERKVDTLRSASRRLRLGGR